MGHFFTFLFTVFLLACCCLSDDTFEAYRLIQYEETSTNTLFGSQKANMDLEAVAYTTLDTPGSFLRKIVVVSYEVLTIDVLDEIIARDASGLLILLPQGHIVLSTETLSAFFDVEAHLFSHHYPLPIYFAETTPSVAGLLEKISHQSSSHLILGENFHVVAKIPEGKPLRNTNAANLHGWLPGAGGGITSTGQPLPTLAIVAHYDTFSVAPGLARGARSNGSGVIAVFQLARIFSKLYSVAKSSAQVNFLFILTDATSFNYEGTTAWIETILKTNGDVVNAIDLAICLDSLVSLHSKELHLYVDEGEPHPILALFENKAAADEISLSLHTLPTPEKSTYLLEHQAFSGRGVSALTMTSNPSPPSSGPRITSMFDRQQSVDLDVLQKNIAFVANVIASYIYPRVADYNIIKASLVPDTLLSQVLYNSLIEQTLSSVFNWALFVLLLFFLLQAFLESFDASARMNPFQDPSVADGLLEIMKTYLTDVNKYEFSPEIPFVFYGSAVANIAVYRVKSILFDVVLLFSIAIFLSLLYFFIKGFQSNLFRMKKKVQ